MFFGCSKTRRSRPADRPIPGPALGVVPIVVFMLGMLGMAARVAWGAAPESAIPRVVATTTVVADLVRQVGGDQIAVDCLMAPGIDPHSYKATPRDADRLARADLVVASGLHLEGKLAELLQKLGRRVPLVAVADTLPRERLLEVAPDL